MRLASSSSPLTWGQGPTRPLRPPEHVKARWHIFLAYHLPYLNSDSSPILSPVDCCQLELFICLFVYLRVCVCGEGSRGLACAWQVPSLLGSLLPAGYPAFRS